MKTSSWCACTSSCPSRSGRRGTISSISGRSFSTTANETTILKFFLSISKDEQLARFKERLDDPGRQWKISASDYKERDYWDDYIGAFEDALTNCSKDHAPWYVIPSNHKWFRNLAVSQIIADTMEDMKLKLPKPTVDLDEIRRLYHAQSKGKAKGG